MPIVVRSLRPTEACLFLEMHSRSVRGLACDRYAPEIIDAWTVPATDENLRRFVENADAEIRLIAELDDRPAGLGALVVAASELRACYVVPEAARKGVGTALVNAMERIAKDSGVERLELLASLNAEPFYGYLGYRCEARPEHVLRNGQRMAAVKMAKVLR